MTWDVADAEYTVFIDNEKIGTYAFHNAGATGVDTLGFKIGNNDMTESKEFLVDDIAIYSNVTGTSSSEVFSDNFESYVINEDLDGDGDLYSGSYSAVVKGTEGSNGSEDTDLPIHPNLDASKAPSENFDLSLWNLSVPIDNGEGDGYAKATTVTVKQLNDGYELTDQGGKDYFWTDTKDGGMVFRDYIGGARTSKNTSYTRTELRGMLRGEDTSISTQGVNGNNWVFGNAPDDQQKLAGGVDGNMIATLAVNAVTTTGDSSHKGRVIVGQIHAASDEPVRIYYRLLPGHKKGSIYFAHEPSNGNSEEWYEMIGSKSSSASEPEDGIELNEKFGYEIDVKGTMLTVSIMRDGKDTITKEVDMSNSGYDGYYVNDDGDQKEDYMYFKAGVYNQNNSGDDTDYVQATFYYLHAEHD
ncbi:polysaccharide lyase family 7 protein [Psychromonas sp. RZ22]|nr:polysaccharide lyase family 7 protein [Psychromonas sp. RZ22]